MSRTQSTTFWVGALLVIALFSAPLFIGLNEPELRNDEAIYSYAVERILDTGHWATPRSIPGDDPFLEKPPLKFWIVAAAIKSGLLPNNDGGLRWFDGLFGAMAFVYIFLLGCRLAGPLCGVVSVMALFTLDPLLFEHGLRSNNMEAAEFLCYCGGMYHFVRWVEDEPSPRRSWQAWAVAAFFALGFLTKFVAAVFLPMVGVAALLVRPGVVTTMRRRWRDWILPVLAVVVVSAPWFIYESRQYGSDFWNTIFGVHVFKRFTSWLDPTHVHPWHYYFSQTWAESGFSRSQILIGAGVVRLTIAAIRGESWLARLIWLWGVLPTALISMGTSKLLHYAYPFWPPIGLGAGLFVAWVLNEVERLGPTMASWLSALVPRAIRQRAAPKSRARTLLVSIAVASLLLAAYALFVGPIRFEIGGLVLFRNSEVVRPLLVAIVLLWIAGQGRTVLRLSALLLLGLILPFQTYIEKIHRLGLTSHPIREARDCIDRVEASGAPAGRGVFVASDESILHHAFYFYLWKTGPYLLAPKFVVGDTIAKLTTAGQETPVIVSRQDYETLVAAVPADTSDLRATLTKGAVRFDDNVAMLLPGPFGVCAASMLAVDAKPIWSRPAVARRP